MKRNLFLKMLSFFAVFCTCFSFAACNMRDDGNREGEGNNSDETDNLLPEEEDGDGDDGDDDEKHIHGEVNELLTVEELIEFHLNGARYPENFVFEELDGYGRVIESAASQEEAIEVATEHFNSGWCTTVECRLSVETDLFYGLYVKWDYRSGGTGEPVSYYDEYVVSFKKQIYDFGNKQFFTRDADIIKSILNYTCYDHEYISPEYLWFAGKVYCSEIAEKDGKYEYTAYGLTTVYGDWGVQDELNFLKLVVEIDSVTGKTAFTVEAVGTVYIDGKGTHFTME